MANPSPVPPLARASSARLNRSKACGEEARREARPVVEDVQLDAAAMRGRTQDDRSPSVAQRVVDEVAEGLLEPDRVGLDLDAAGRLSVDPAAYALAPGA